MDERWYIRSIDADWNAMRALPQDELVKRASEPLALLGGEGRYAGGPLDRLRQWIEDEVTPVLRSMGPRGQELWSYLTDSSSLANVQRIGALVILFSLLLGLDQVTPANVTAMVCLAIQLTSSEDH